MNRIAAGIAAGSALAAALGLGGCSYDRRPSFSAAPTARIPADYRRQIAAWARRYYVEGDSVRFLAISEPVPVRLTLGIEAWLVCAEFDARQKGGPYMGPRRIAFGIAPGQFSAPMQRGRLDLMNEDCDAPHLAWREWRDEPAERRRRG